MPRQDAFLYGDVVPPCEIHDGLSRNPLQRTNVRRRREKDSILRDENVVAGAFRHIPLVIHHHRSDGSQSSGGHESPGEVTQLFK